MPNRIASVLMICALGSVSAAALAQPAAAPSTTVAPLTVQAAPQPKVIQKEAHSFVQTYAAVPNPELDQIGRWRDPVCVQVVGLPQADQAAAIKARVESVSQAVGVPAARAGCKANVEIVFTDQPQRTLDVVAHRRPYLLGYNKFYDPSRLRTVTHPIQSWYFATNVKWTCNVSRITACLDVGFANVFIVADSKALAGKDIGVVADDMAMLALSQPRSLDGCGALPSVIDGFAKSACPGRDPPGGLTPADAAYLTALYKTDLEAFKGYEMGELTSRMASILIKANAVAAAGAAPTSSPPTNR